jgi:predicted nucleic acid-binding protein
MTYSNAGHGEPGWRAALMAQYASFVQAAVAGNVRVHCCGLSLAELSHTIEKTEREIHELSTSSSIKSKEYRHNFAAQRTHVVTAIEAAWAQVTSLAELLTVTIDSPTATAAVTRLQTEKVDGHDLFILESMRSHGVVQVITDDGDFATVHGIQVFTANRNVIQAARTQGRLITR